MFNSVCPSCAFSIPTTSLSLMVVDSNIFNSMAASYVLVYLKDLVMKQNRCLKIEIQKCTLCVNNHLWLPFFEESSPFLPEHPVVFSQHLPHCGSQNNDLGNDIGGQPIPIHKWINTVRSPNSDVLPIQNTPRLHTIN